MVALSSPDVSAARTPLTQELPAELTRTLVDRALRDTLEVAPSAMTPVDAPSGMTTKLTGAGAPTGVATLVITALALLGMLRRRRRKTTGSGEGSDRSAIRPGVAIGASARVTAHGRRRRPEDPRSAGTGAQGRPAGIDFIVD